MPGEDDSFIVTSNFDYIHGTDEMLAFYQCDDAGLKECEEVWSYENTVKFKYTGVYAFTTDGTVTDVLYMLWDKIYEDYHMQFVRFGTHEHHRVLLEATDIHTDKLISMQGLHGSKYDKERKFIMQFEGDNAV